MRQVGIIAAAGIYALDHHIDRLALDHAHAQKLARGLSRIAGIRLDPDTVETNIIVFDISPTGTDPHRIVEFLRERGILLIPFGKTLIRAVTHLDVSSEDIEIALKITAEVFADLTRTPGKGWPSRAPTHASK